MGIKREKEMNDFDKIINSFATKKLLKGLGIHSKLKFDGFFKII